VLLVVEGGRWMEMEERGRSREEWNKREVSLVEEGGCKGDPPVDRARRKEGSKNIVEGRRDKGKKDMCKEGELPEDRKREDEGG
jgi:hypothetical protein